jgi:MoaA/NifB/PqqE/SkfB family radical SAM enzyme
LRAGLVRSGDLPTVEVLSPESALQSELVSFLVPRAGAIVRLRDGGAEVEAGGWGASFEGGLADDVAQVATGHVSRRLEALAKSNPAAAALVSWRDHEWLPLTALAAVRLDGFDTLFLELVGTCNERCVHCYADSSPTVKAALSRELCETIVDDAHAAGFRRIQFTGGDPLICKFLPELVERAAAYQTREIYTNGLLLDDALLDRLAPHRPAFAFSYYSNDADVHDAITRTPGSQRRTRAAIERVLRRGLPARVSIVVFDQNVGTVDATVAELEALGVKTVASAPQKTGGRGQAFAWQPRMDTGGGHRSPGGGEPGSEGKLAIAYTGEVIPCIFNRSRVLGNVDEHTRLRDVLAALAVTPGPAAGDDRLSCTSCRITDLALATLGAA